MKVKIGYTDKDETRYNFICPGCDQEHEINHTWEFNQDFDNPTFKPSILIQSGRYDKLGVWTPMRCHSYIRKGKIKFLKDCSHDLAGTTDELPNRYDKNGDIK